MEATAEERESSREVRAQALFIVGTGRCGSTLLSRMLARNPAVLDVSEYFVGIDWSRRFQKEPMSGEEFWSLLVAPHPLVSELLRRGVCPPEVTYPFETPGARFKMGEPLPWILTSVLGAVSDNPDQLYDKLAGYCCSLVKAPPAIQALRVLEWLTATMGRMVWIERSGAAITYLGELQENFPDARFLHLHRQGEATALSLREHPVFRLGAMLTYEISMGEGGSTAELEALGADADRIDQLLASRPPAHYFGRWWSSQLLTGLAALHSVSPERYCEVSFEDLLQDPEPMLARVAAFFELPNPDGNWRKEASALVHGSPVDRFESLADTERDELRWACLPGNRLLGRGPMGNQS